jgi:hypothetical protein
MDQEPKDISTDERVVIIVVASLPLSLSPLPRPHSLELISKIAGRSKRRVHRALKSLRLQSVLSEAPESAYEQAATLMQLYEISLI